MSHALDHSRPATPMSTASQDASPAALAGGRVLLVEDNAINQQVARGLLELLGVEVTVAGDGQEALDCVRAGRFHAILMDVQMPRMDGLEAATRIRHEIGLTDVPIIAMTAHAMAEDRVRSLAAGMNDHLTKPIDPGALQAALMRWMLPRMAGGVRITSSRPAHPSSRPKLAIARRASHSGLTLLEIPGVDLVAARRHVSDNLELLRKVLLDFSRDQPADVDRLRDAVGAGDWARVLRVAHTLKGTAATVGALSIARVAEQLEALASQGGGASAGALVDDLESRMDVVVGSVTALIAPRAPLTVSGTPSTRGDAVPAPATVAVAEQLVAGLRRALSEGDPGAGDVAAELARLLSGTRIAGAAAVVARHAGNFDFDDASAALVSLSAALGERTEGQP